MFFRGDITPPQDDPTRLMLQDLIAIQPRHIRGHLEGGGRGPGGERPGRGRATTLDFDGLSPYVPGDDVRNIDWRATMRTSETVVRRFAATSYRAHMLVVDLRPEHYFGTSDRIMAKTTCLTAAWLTWNALALHEPIGMFVGGVKISPKRGRRHVLRLLECLIQSYSEGGATRRLTEDFDEAASMLGRRDELCVISDLPVNSGPLEAFGRTMSRSRIMRFVLVEDPFTKKPPQAGRYPVRGPNGVRQVIRVASGVDVSQTIENRLRDAGWIVDYADHLLPRQAAT